MCGAVETALLDRLQSVVVDTADTAFEGIRYLAEMKGGRATFLPMDDSGPESEVQIPPG